MHPLHEALLEGDTYTFKTLLLTVNPSCIDRENGKSGLHYAAELGNFTYVDLLLDKKASLLKVDKKGHTILHSAAMGNLTDLTDILIKAGADVHAVDASRRPSDCLVPPHRSHRLLPTRGSLTMCHHAMILPDRPLIQQYPASDRV